MREIAVVDIGGTNARFALARLSETGIELSDIRRYGTGDYSSLAAAWHGFARDHGNVLPRAASIAVAGAVGGETVKLANSPWVVRPRALHQELGLDQLTLVNDFGAIAHAVDAFSEEDLEWLSGPRVGRPTEGVITVIGPGTGLGVAMVLRRSSGHHVIETEGGHMDFAPLDAIEEQILARLRSRHLRVSVERIVSGPGLANVYEAIAAIEGTPAKMRDDPSLWAAAIGGSDELAATALDRFCMSFGSVAGDIALAQGASAVVLAGQLSKRIAEKLRGGNFIERFRSKGRYRSLMESIPILLCRHDEPGLYGAAAAFRKEHL